MLILASGLTGTTAAFAQDANVQPLPAAGDITLTGCEGTTSQPNGVINTPGQMVLTGRAASDLRAGKTVFLYDNKGLVILKENGEYFSNNARVPFCGAKIEGGEVSVAWRYCTDEAKGACANEPPSEVPGNDKLTRAQVQAIASVLATSDMSNKRARALTQLQVWCVSEGYSPGQVQTSAQTYFNNHQFSGGASAGSAFLTDAEATCAPWAELPATPTLDITGPASPVDLGDEARFTVEVNFTGDVQLSVTAGQAIALCAPPTQTGVSLADDRLRFDAPGSAEVCVTATVAGGMTLTGRGDDIPLADDLTFLWSGSLSCQVFADFAAGGRVDVVARAGATVLGIPGFELSKTSDPADGEEVDPFDTITYTLTGTNTGETVLDPVVIEDDLSGLFDHVELVGGPTATIGAATVTPPVLDTTAETIRWEGTLQQGEAVVISYTVEVLASAEGQVLENRVTGSATPPGKPPIVPPPVDTEHPVPVYGFEVDKVSDLGEDTEVHPGDVLTYTVVGRNTGTEVLDPVEIIDDLSGLAVGEYTVYNGDAAASVGAAPVVDLDAQTLTWTGALQPGEQVELTYSVTVTTDAPGHMLENRVTASGTPPTGPPIVPPPVDTENPSPEPGFELGKTSDPASGSAVLPGEDIVYTVTGSNTGQTVLTDVVIVDDASKVADFATVNDDAFATIDGRTPAPTLTVDPAAGTITWAGTLQPGETVTITYSVTVNPGTAGALLENIVDGQATPPGTPSRPIKPPRPGTEHPVPTPGFTLAKSSDPASGTVVMTGDTIEYTVTGANTGQTRLDPVEIHDDLTGLQEHARYNDDARATVGGVDAGTLALDPEGAVLSWIGALDAGETVVITYSVTLTADVDGQVLANRVTGSAQPPSFPPIEPPDQGTEHPMPGFELGKTADPASGTTVLPGDRITYTLTGANTGTTVLDPVVIEDDLGGLWAHVTYNDDAFATIDGTTSAGALELDARARTLTWTGVLQGKETVTITYSVTVDRDAAGVVLDNVVEASATPPGRTPITPPKVNTEHPVPFPDGSLPATGMPAMTGILGGGLLLLLAGVAVTLASLRRRV